MINLQENQERVLLVGVETFENSKTFASSMEELAALTETAGGMVVDSFTQKRERIDNRTVIGSGKVAELEWILQSDTIDTIIFNDRLSPRQNANLEAALNVKVIDRMQLILDIFALRARSHEGMLQVEQAQLNYLLPRLSGQGTSLNRQGGGIGTRGPGETQLEKDRRHIRYRIQQIDEAIDKVEKTRQTMRQKRDKSTVFKIGLVGYTNAGKSSIMNALVGEEKSQYEKDELFATLDATTKLVKLRDEFTVSLTDTVGFIQNLPTELVKAFKSTLDEATQVDMLVHVIDASNPDHQIHEETVQSILADLETSGIPVLNVYNKMDIAKDFIPTLTPAVPISIKSADGVQWFKTAVLDKINGIFEHFEIKLPYAEAYKLPELKKIALIDEVIEEEEDYLVIGMINPKSAWQLENYHRK